MKTNDEDCISNAAHDIIRPDGPYLETDDSGDDNSNFNGFQEPFDDDQQDELVDYSLDDDESDILVGREPQVFLRQKNNAADDKNEVTRASCPWRERIDRINGPGWSEVAVDYFDGQRQENVEFSHCKFSRSETC